MISSALSDDLKIRAMRSKGLTEELAKQALATASTTAAEKVALKSQNALSRGISSLKNGFIGLGKAMAAHPYITIAIAATTLISVMVALAKNAKTTEEKIADLNEKFSEISEKVKNASSEFQNLKKSTDSIIPRFAELSKGVDRFGYHSLMFLSNIITKASTQHSDSLCSVQALFFAVIAALLLLTNLLTIDFNS